MPAAQRLAALLLATTLLASCVGPVATGSSENEIRAALEEWVVAFNRRDVPKVCDLFAPDLISSYQGQPERGYDAICELLGRSLHDDTRSYSYALNLQEIIVSGDLAAVRLIWTLEIDRKDGSPKLANVEPGLDIFRRQADGKWRIQRYIAYSTTP